MMLYGCIVAMLLLSGAGSAAAQLSSGSQWAGTWASAPVGLDSKNNFANQTLRQILHTSVGGSLVRIQFSNLFGVQPLRIEDVHIAQRNSGSSILPGTDRQLRFGGHTFAVILPRTEAVSDPVAFPVPRVGDIAVSLYLPGPTGQPTFHPSAHQTSYVAPGDVSSSDTLPDAKTTDSYYFLTGVDVQGQDIRGSVVTLGASITEGYSSTHGTNRSWPSVLAARLADDSLNIAVLNEGISGNRLLADGAGPGALSRFDRDVLSQPGVHWVIFSDDPINDLGSTNPAPTADELIAGIQRLITRAHENHIQFFCSTLTPYEGANYWTPSGEAAREQVNAFLRHKESGCDAVIDQDTATHDPAHPLRYLPAYDNGDHLHPNDAGHRAIANDIDLSLFLHPGPGQNKR